MSRPNSSVATLHSQAIAGSNSARSSCPECDPALASHQRRKVEYAAPVNSMQSAFRQSREEDEIQAAPEPTI